jgi:hypothetical protein
MSSIDAWCHTGSIEINCEAMMALDYVADGIKQGEWALGSIDRREIGDGLFEGTSMFGAGTEYIRIRVDRDNHVVYYDVGHSLDDLRTLNVIRVVPGSTLGVAEDNCIVTLLSWRPEGTPDEAWARNSVSHETEMYIIKARLESRRST